MQFGLGSLYLVMTHLIVNLRGNQGNGIVDGKVIEILVVALSLS